jgi:hypothetical protein
MAASAAYWQHAAKLLLEAAEGASAEAVTDQLVHGADARRYA